MDRDVIASRGTLTGLAVVNAVKPMLDLTFDRVVRRLLPHEIKFPMIETMCNLMNCRQIIRPRLIELLFLPDVVTAQRVLVNVPLRDQAHTMQEWMNLAAPGGKLMEDVSRPYRIPAIEWLRPISTFRRRDLGSLDLFEVGAHGYQLVEEEIWGEAHGYARRLARAAGLVIENDMPV